MKKTRILFCGEFPRANNCGGSPTVNAEIVSYLRCDERFSVEALSPIFAGDVLTQPLQGVTFLPTSHFRGKGFGDVLGRYSFLRNVKEWIRKHGMPDILHCDEHTLLATQFPRLPKVLFLHGCSKKIISLSSIRHPYSSLCHLMCAADEYSAVMNRDVKKIFINSEFSRQILVKAHRLKEEYSRKIEVIKLGFNVKRLGIDGITKEYARSWLMKKLGKNFVEAGAIGLFVGGLASHKGQYDLIELIDSVRGFRCSLILVGKDAGDETRVRTAIAQKKLSHSITLLGSLSDHELGLAFRASDLYLSASCEGFGINQVEAMAAGLPLIALNRGAVPELFRDGEHGFLVESKKDFIYKLSLLAHDEAFRQSMGEHARQHAFKEFSWEHVAERVADAYASISLN